MTTIRYGGRFGDNQPQLADSPPLRGYWLAGNESYHAVLDSRRVAVIAGLIVFIVSGGDMLSRSQVLRVAKQGVLRLYGFDFRCLRVAFAGRV